MSQDRESEVRLLFLTEAREYLEEVESDLLNLNQGRIDRPTLDKMLRAVHSIKGGGAMMGFIPLSDIAHRIEDFFNILKSGRVKAIAANDPDTSDLERLFLISVDKMREVITFHTKGSKVTSEWLETNVAPIFQQLHAILGDYSVEDNISVISADDGEDMRTFMFETEVDTCLERLEKVLAEPNSPVVREEFLIASQEFGCLGEMLDLQAFTALCESITLAIESQQTPLEMREIAESAVKLWRRSQALVLIGQFGSMPSQLVAIELLPKFIQPIQIIPAEISFPDEISFIEDENVFSGLEQLLGMDADFEFDLLSQSELLIESDNLGDEIQITDDFTDFEINFNETDDISELIDPIAVPSSNPSSNLSEVPKQIKSELDTSVRSESKGSDSENTIRVAVRQLDRLADLSGDFTSERNTLNLQLKQFRNLIELLRRRVQTLEQSNSLLRSSYDRSVTNIPTTPLLINQILLSDSFSKGFNNINGGFSDRFDALEMDRYSDLHLVSREIMDNVVQLQEVTSDIETALSEVESTEREFGRTNKQMQTGITQVRMRPLSDIVSRFPRVIREMSVQYGKQVELKIRGGNTLIERTMLEALNDPLLHLIRNAFDHGIEYPETRTAQSKSAIGLIVISASYRGSQTIITVEDDGKGIDINKVRAKALTMGVSEDDLNAVSQQEILELIFEPGFSTASQVTDLSGRGVGMDVVRSNLNKVKGTVGITTQSGKGTTFTIALPSSQSVTRVLLVESNGMLMAFPTNAIEEMLLLNGVDPFPEKYSALSLETEAIEWEGYTTPLIHLDQYLKFSQSQRLSDTDNIPVINEPVILIVASQNQPYAIQCDRYWGEQEIATRLVEGMAMPTGFSSCAILGGKVVPLVDAEKLLELILTPLLELIITPSIDELDHVKAIAPTQNINQNTSQKTIMIVDDSINVRRFLALTLEKAGYRVEQAKDGQEALEKLQTNQTINAIICDVEMPRLDGFGFLAQSQSEDKLKHIPVIMLTSRSSNKHRQLAMNLGATAYFSKPFKEAELLETLSQLTNSSMQSRTNTPQFAYTS